MVVIRMIIAKNCFYEMAILAHSRTLLVLYFHDCVPHQCHWQWYRRLMSTGVVSVAMPLEHVERPSQVVAGSKALAVC